MTQTNQAQIVASTLRSIDAGGLINAQLDKAATLMDSQHARILELEAELLTEKRHQRTRDVAAVRTLGALGFNWNGSDVWQAAPKAVGETEKELIQALMDKHQIGIQQTTYEELDKPPYDLYAVQAEKHQFEAFVQDLIALCTIQPAAQPLITELENIAYTYAMNLRDAACATYVENTERMARNAKVALTNALQGVLCKQPGVHGAKSTLNRIAAAAEAMSEVMAHTDLGARGIKFERALAGLRAVLACTATQPAAQGLDAQALKSSFREYLSVNENIAACAHAMDGIATELTNIVLAEQEVSTVLVRRKLSNTSGQSGEDSVHIRAAALAAQAKQGGADHG